MCVIVIMKVVVVVVAVAAVATKDCIEKDADRKLSIPPP